MAQVRLETEPRTDFGKGFARRLRAAGRVPAVVYGGHTEVRHVSVPGHELMLALKKAQVILQVEVGGETLSVAPRQIQKDPVRQTLTHVDLLVLSAQEVRERIVVGAAVAKATAVAAEEELDAITLVVAVRELLDEGIEVDDAIAQAVTSVKEAMAAQAAAAAAAAAAEDAAEGAAAAESEEGEGAVSGDRASSDES